MLSVLRAITYRRII